MAPLVSNVLCIYMHRLHFVLKVLSVPSKMHLSLILRNYYHVVFDLDNRDVAIYNNDYMNSVFFFYKKRALHNSLFQSNIWARLVKEYSNYLVLVFISIG